MATDFSQRGLMILFVYMIMIVTVVGLFATLQVNSKNEGVYYGPDNEVRVIEGYQSNTQNRAEINETIDLTAPANQTTWWRELFAILRFRMSWGKQVGFMETASNALGTVFVLIPTVFITVLTFFSFRN